MSVLPDHGRLFDKRREPDMLSALNGRACAIQELSAQIGIRVTMRPKLHRVCPLPDLNRHGLAASGF